MNWLAILLLLFFGGCVTAIWTVPRYTFTTQSRARGCTSNQNSIDKHFGVWEAMNVPLPTKIDGWIELDTRGRVVRVSPSLEPTVTGPLVEPRGRLHTGSPVLWGYGKHDEIWRCPSRVDEVGDKALTDQPEIHDRWITSREPSKLLGDKTRGAICLLHHDVGPRHQPDAHHRRYD